MRYDAMMREVERYEKFAAALVEESYPCVHGHLDCSPTPGGACIDELYSQLSDETRAYLEHPTTDIGD